MASQANANNNTRPTIAQRIERVSSQLEEREHVVITQPGCKIECYRRFLRLPVECKVLHASSCECRVPDPILVQSYITKVYFDATMDPQAPSDTLRLLPWLIHEFCRDFATATQGEFEVPAFVPEPELEFITQWMGQNGGLGSG